MAHYKNKQKRPLKVAVKVILGIVLAAICAFIGAFVAGWSITGNPNPTQWRTGNSKLDDEGKPDDDNVGTIDHGIRLMMTSVAVDDFEAYGISEQAISAKTVQAEFDPLETTDKRVTWTLTWSNPNSTFAQNKNVSDYVNLIPAANNQPACTLEYLQGFGTSMRLRCEAIANDELYSIITVGCVGKIIDTTGCCLIDSLSDDLFNPADGDKHFSYHGTNGTHYTTYPDDAGLDVVADYTFTFDNEVVKYLREHYNSELFAEDTFTLSGENISYSTPLILQPQNKTVTDTEFWKALVSYCVNYGESYIGYFTIGEVKYYDGDLLVWSSGGSIGNCDVELSDNFMQQFTVAGNSVSITPSGAIYF